MNAVERALAEVRERSEALGAADVAPELGMVFESLDTIQRRVLSGYVDGDELELTMTVADDLARRMEDAGRMIAEPRARHASIASMVAQAIQFGAAIERQHKLEDEETQGYRR